jgi:glycosyltransferase involved in cell wall biosynthesis
MSSKILLIAPLVNKKKPELTGGAVIAFQNLLSHLELNNVSYTLVDSNKKNYNNIIYAYFFIFIQIFIKQFRVQHISLHSSKDYILLAPFIIFLGKIFNKTTSLRKFGGEAWDTFIQAKTLKKKLLYFIFTNIDFLFLETKFLVIKFELLNKKTFWFPNVRNFPSKTFERKAFSKRFVFMGHVKQEKGIDELIRVSKLLDKSYTIDIYGVISDKKYSKLYFDKEGISYKGAVRADKVLEILASYDVLLLPSYREGYPGVVIESYSLGLPIISTNLTGLKEITVQYKTGILIEPKDVNALKKSIEYFTFENYEKMSIHAKEKFKLFNADFQANFFMKTLSL